MLFFFKCSTICSTCFSLSTGKKAEFSSEQLDYFRRLKDKKTNHPKLIGFGIRDRKAYDTVCEYADGAIIGSAFLNALNNKKNLHNTIQTFIQSIRP